MVSGKLFIKKDVSKDVRKPTKKVKQTFVVILNLHLMIGRNSEKRI